MSTYCNGACGKRPNDRTNDRDSKEATNCCKKRIYRIVQSINSGRATRKERRKREGEERPAYNLEERRKREPSLTYNWAGKMTHTL